MVGFLLLKFFIIIHEILFKYTALCITEFESKKKKTNQNLDRIVCVLSTKLSTVQIMEFESELHTFYTPY